MDYQSQALILKTRRLNEADKILHLYSREHGPIRAIAKSAFKVKSKISAKSQILNCCEFLLAKGRNLDIVKEVKLVKNFSDINSDYNALTLACFFVDILDHIAISDDHYEEPFDLIVNYLRDMNEACNDNKDLLIAISTKYLWQLIDLLGYKPELNNCSISHSKRSAKQIPQYFDLENGAITSSQAYLDYSAENPYQDSIRELKPGVFKVLFFYDLISTYSNFDTGISSVRAHMDKLQAIENLDKAMIDSLRFLHKHLEYRLHKEFKSWKLVEEMLSNPMALAA